MFFPPGEGNRGKFLCREGELFKYPATKVGTMRPKEFPRLLFETIHQAVGSPNIETHPCYTPWEYFAIRDGENEPFGHIGYEEGRPHPNGVTNKVGVWGSVIRDPTEEEGTVEILNPLLEIVGGPQQGGVWAVGRGNSIIEEVRVNIGTDFSYYGLALKSPAVKLIAEVLDISHKLAHKTQLPTLSYWEAFRHPDGDFTRPD